MPQFDISSFIVQLVWLFVSFLGFYFLFTWKYLPSWALLLKTRKKPLSSFSLKGLTFADYKLNPALKSSKVKLPTKTGIFFS